jgi:hypothetical protein
MPVRLPMDKLKLLYLIEQTSSPVSRDDLWEFCEPWSSYFPLQQALFDLYNTGLIKVSAVFTTERRYEIAENGIKTLQQLYLEIPLSKRNKLEQDAKLLREKSRTAVMYLADYHKLERGQYVADLRISECGILLMQISVNLPTMEQANAICQNWAQAAADVYKQILVFADPLEGKGDG